MSNVRLLARLSYLVVAGLVLLNAGCLAVALGTAGAAGAEMTTVLLLMEDPPTASVAWATIVYVPAVKSPEGKIRLQLVVPAAGLKTGTALEKEDPFQ